MDFHIFLIFFSFKSNFFPNTFYKDKTLKTKDNSPKNYIFLVVSFNYASLSLFKKRIFNCVYLITLNKKQLLILNEESLCNLAQLLWHFITVVVTTK
jgi:hypothetical protein